MCVRSGRFPLCVCVCQDMAELRGVAEQLVNQLVLGSGRGKVSHLQYAAVRPTSSRFLVTAANSTSSFSLPPTLTPGNTDSSQPVH